LSLFTIFATAFVVGFSGALVPGPLLAVTVAETRRLGAKAGPLTVAGHAAAELAMAFALWLGLSRIFASQPVIVASHIAGGLALVWIGRGNLRAAVGGAAMDLDSDVKGRQPRVDRGSALGAVGSGAAATVSYPYWILWWATIGASYVALALAYGATGVLVFWTGHVLSDFVWYTFVSGVVAGSQRLLGPSVYRIVLGACGAFLVVLGAYFIYTGGKALI